MTGTRTALVCGSRPPECDRDSGSKRLFDLVRLLRDGGWAVMFVSAHEPGDPRATRVLQQMGVAVHDGSKLRIGEMLEAVRFDLALFASWSVAEIYLPIVRRAAPFTRVVVDSVDLHFLRTMRGVFREGAARGEIGELEHRHGIEFARELNVYAAADAVLAVSSREAAWIHDLVGAQVMVSVVPDLEELAVSEVARTERRGIVFIGSFRHHPNRAAVEFLCRDVLPLLEPELGIRHPVYVIGEAIDETVRRLGDGLPQVRMVGWVPSVIPYLERARLSVVPLSYGAGTKRKLLQTLMAGTPAVSTRIGIEGFGLSDEEHVLVADEAAGFAKAIIRLLRDNALWKRLSRQGRAHVERTHGYHAVEERFRNVIDRLLAAGPRRGRRVADASQRKPARLDRQEYARLREEIGRVAHSVLPQRATVAVVSRGDDELLKMTGRTAWHFPANGEGIYAGHHPADCAEAIAGLEALRARGADHLLLPVTALWWLDHYADFRHHLETHYRELAHGGKSCVIYDLRAAAVAIPQSAGDGPGSSTESVNDGAGGVRLIAFYLPQFHPIPENDAWWGAGFTDWTNVRRARPLFPGHYQPHVPSELGHYDLRDAEVRERQAQLAREHGIHAFCYYHYWFGGKRLLERPFNEVLASGRPDFPFCLCWANEPWSRRWNGQPEAVLQAQTYSPADDLAHIHVLLPALADPRAIRIDGRPVFLIYQGRALPEPARTIETWRQEASRAGLPGVHLIAVETGWDAGWDATKVGFDAKVLFQPQFSRLSNSGKRLRVAEGGELEVFDYQGVWPVLADSEPAGYRCYETVCPGWDNTPRRGRQGVVLHNSSPAAYEQWLRRALEKVRSQPREQRLVFLNAWNEWGEGCHLEPDVLSGRSYLEVTRRAVNGSGDSPVSAHVSESGTESPAAVSVAEPGRNGRVAVAGVSVAEDRPRSVKGSEPTAEREAYRSLLATARGEQGKDFLPFAEPDPAGVHMPVKLFAFYLPQYHAIPENDRWWGRGFTEWTNVTKAVPQFAGHYQPHLPGELGFYDLRLPEVQRRQVELAKSHGVAGFCFYYYWFAGKRLLERPLIQFTADNEINFPFCLCWANENWTRAWDGCDQEILVAQQHGEEMDLAFMRDTLPFLGHRNYLKIHGRPVLIVYRAQLLPDPAGTARGWRELCRREGVAEPYLIAAQVFERVDPRAIGWDAAVEFPPNTPGERAELNSELPLLNPEYAGRIHRYTDLMELTCGQPRPAYPLFRTVCPGWDNEPRRPGRGTTYAFSSPRDYGRWLDRACRLTLENPDRDQHLVFINAWNEWGEGAHLEPDRRHGYAYLRTTANVLAGLPRRLEAPGGDWTILFVSHDAHRGGAQSVLLNVLAWFREHTAIRLKVLCLGAGEWLQRFKEQADTVLLNELEEQAAVTPGSDIGAPLLEFCGGRPALIYANSVASGRLFRTLVRLGVPILTHFHELQGSIQRYAGEWIGDVIEHSAHYIACSEPVQSNLMRRHRISAKRITTVHASIRADKDFKIPGDPERKTLRSKLGLFEDGHLVFGCGVGMPFRKGADLFIEVARQVRRQGRKDIHFYWLGEFATGESDPELGVWADHLTALRESGDTPVTFLGVKDDPRQFLRAADLFLLSSREDPFPLVALEAADCGVPVVCFSGAGGMPSFVGEDAGCVVPFGDVRTMAERIVALAADGDLRRRLGARAREKLHARFTVETTSPRIFSVCRRVAGRKPAVSVIVPNYNHGRYLEERLESIFNQTFRDFEVILLDDASTDESLNVLERWVDRPDVRLVRNRRNSGSPFKQWLKGMDLARADILWIAESDDRCEPDFLECLLPAFQDQRVRLAYTNSHVVDENSVVIGDYTAMDYLASLSPTKWLEEYRVSAEQEINDGLGIKNTILSASSVVFRRFELDREMRRMLGRLRLAGDWYFMVHAIACGEVHYTPRKLNYHRRHAESVIGKLLRQNRVTDFFREFYLVQCAILRRYCLHEGFQEKWEQYLRDQWRGFFPDRPFEQLSRYYPVERVREQLVSGRVSAERAWASGG